MSQQPEIVSSTNIPKKKVKLVIDTNAFIKCLDLKGLSENYDLVTIDDVFYEIKDQRAREQFVSSGLQLKTKEPSDSSIKYVRKFATKTGDIASLSEVDINVMALAYTFAQEFNTHGTLRKNPPEMTEYIHQQNFEEDSESDDQGKPNQKETEEKKQDDQWVVVADQKQQNGVDKNQQQYNLSGSNNQNLINETEQKGVTQIELAPKIEQIEENQQIEEPKEAQIKQADLESKQGVDVVGDVATEKLKMEAALLEPLSDMDDDEGWINSKNISQHLNLYKETSNKENELGVAIITSDYSMQNVLLQIGLPLVAVDGLRITRAKRFVLECYVCKFICKVPTQEYCPQCGNHSMLKVSCSINSDGTFYLFRKKGFTLNLRGMKYSIPQMKPGRHAENIILRQDELLMAGKAKQLKQELQEQERRFNNAVLEYENGLGFDNLKKQQVIKTSLQYGYGRKNPNDINTFKNKY